MMSQTSEVLVDSMAMEQISPASRQLYKKTFISLRSFLGRDMEDFGPTEQELLNFFKNLREVKLAASSSLWTIYSQINSFCKAKYNVDLKKFNRVIAYIKANHMGDKNLFYNTWAIKMVFISPNQDFSSK